MQVEHWQLKWMRIVICVGALAIIFGAVLYPRDELGPQKASASEACTTAAQQELVPPVAQPAEEIKVERSGSEWLVSTSVKQQTTDRWYDVTCVVTDGMFVRSVTTAAR